MSERRETWLRTQEKSIAISSMRMPASRPSEAGDSHKELARKLAWAVGTSFGIQHYSSANTKLYSWAFGLAGDLLLRFQQTQEITLSQ